MVLELYRVQLCRFSAGGGLCPAGGGRADRKGLLVLPLCPVYGAGACLILAPPRWVDSRPLALFLLGGLTATAAEYLAALWHEKALGVSFWDYHGLPGNLRGRVCLPFSLAWGALSLGLVYRVHPALSPWLARIPDPVGWAALATLAGRRPVHRRRSPEHRGHRQPAVV